MVTTAVSLIFAMGILWLFMRPGNGELDMARKRPLTEVVTDPVTALLGREHMLMRAEQEVSRVLRREDRAGVNAMAGCIMVDLDHFRQLNDKHGNTAGDEVLREMARRLNTSVRHYDLVGRHGGEKFMVLLPDGDFESTLVVAKRIWKGVRNKPFSADRRKISATVSLGFACVESGDEGARNVVSRAERALRRARDSGRDQLVWLQKNCRRD